MESSHIAKNKVGAAEEATTTVQAALYVAHKALDGRSNTNAYGVFIDPAKLRCDLVEARYKLEQALKVIDNTQWPKSADYDLI